MREEYPVYIAERLGIDLGYKIYPEGDPGNLIDGFFLGYSSVMNAVEKEIGLKARCTTSFSPFRTQQP